MTKNEVSELIEKIETLRVKEYWAGANHHMGKYSAASEYAEAAEDLMTEIRDTLEQESNR